MIETGKTPHQRYSTVAIALHWVTAVAIVAMILMGFWMTGAINDPEQQAAAYRTFQLHKSLGLLILVLTLLRLGWRIVHRTPPLPQMPEWQQWAARVSHFLLYTFMLVMPLTGWLYVSTGWNSQTGAIFNIPTMWFGLFQWPHIPAVGGSAAVADVAISIHAALAWGFVALLVLHVLAALKHHFADRSGVLWSMLPFIPHPESEKRMNSARNVE